MKFTVVIPTRNRPALFATALKSVLAQTSRSFDVVVVDDGSTDENRQIYSRIIEGAGRDISVVELPCLERGHGGCYAINRGAEQTDSAYICFLDDDDEWTDPDHLLRLERVIDPSRGEADLILCNQAAFQDGAPVNRSLWIEDLQQHLEARNLRPDVSGAYEVTPEDLLRCRGFCHLNTTVIARPLFNAIEGLDEGLRYEGDRDFFLRAIDRAKRIRHVPQKVSRHNIPDPTKRANMSTIVSEIEKRMAQLRIMDRSILLSARPEIRSYAKRHKGYALKAIAEILSRQGRHELAAQYAMQALAGGFTLKWLGACGLYQLKRCENMLRHDRGSG